LRLVVEARGQYQMPATRTAAGPIIDISPSEH
jgi:hypothetical protein